MKNLPLLVVTLFTTLALIVGVAVMFSKSSEPVVVADQGMLMGTNRPTKGSEQASVTVVEFSDFQCPACKGVEPLVDSLQQKYSSQVKVIYRHFPLLSIHPHALLAAQAAEAAHTEGKFWEMHDKLFATQETWAALKTDDEAKELFATYAQELGIDKAAFLAKINSDEIKKIVADDLSAGNEVKVDATPTFFVNGRKLTASQQLLPTVESLLK